MNDSDDLMVRIWFGCLIVVIFVLAMAALVYGWVKV